jgi:hypothetical protein
MQSSPPPCYLIPLVRSIYLYHIPITYKVPYKIKSVHLLVIKVIITKMHGATHIKDIYTCIKRV